MAKGGSGGENYQHDGTWTEQEARRVGEGGGEASGTARRRCDDAGSSAHEAMVCGEDGPLMQALVSSTGYSSDAFERDEEQFIYDLERSRVSRKSVKKAKRMRQESSSCGVRGARGAPFAFKRRAARIDWRSLHSVDVDRLIREVDIDTLEMVLDTIAFGDIQGEDTRNFTEANFVKIFRLAQLMVEYLLHVQELLADHKSELLQSRSAMQRKDEKLRSRFLWQRDALLQTRHELKQAKKTLQTYEVMLKIQGKHQVILACQSNQQQVQHCPFCEKVFESSYYLDLHVARKHQQKQEVAQDKILVMVSTAEGATAARVHNLYPSPLLS